MWNDSFVAQQVAAEGAPEGAGCIHQPAAADARDALLPGGHDEDGALDHRAPPRPARLAAVPHGAIRGERLRLLP